MGIVKTNCTHTQKKKKERDNTGRADTQIRAETYVSYLVSGLEFHIGPLWLTTELYPGLQVDASIIACKKPRVLSDLSFWTFPPFLFHVATALFLAFAFFTQTLLH